MSALYSSKSEALTPQNIVEAYRAAYYAVMDRYPDDCWHSQGRWFIINGVERERGWVLIEIERLRQEALVKAMEVMDKTQHKNTARGKLLRLIKRLSSF